MFINHCNLLNMFSIARIAERGKHPNHCRKDIWWFGFEQSQECSSGGLILLCLPSILPLLLTSKHCYFDGSWNMKYVIIVSIFLVIHSQHTNHRSFSNPMVSEFCELIFLVFFHLSKKKKKRVQLSPQRTLYWLLENRYIHHGASAVKPLASMLKSWLSTSKAWIIWSLQE